MSTTGRAPGPNLAGAQVADDTHRLEVPVRPERREEVALALWMMGASGTWEQPQRIVAWFTAPPDTDAYSATVPELRGDDVTLTTEPDRDWQAAWKATIAPVDAGRFTVVPTWLAAEHQPRDDELTVVLDPGRAFGTGHHATTTLCLELLDELDRAHGLDGRTLADIGCGSGILAIAAAARGAEVQAVDIDEDAAAVTRENAAGNHVQLRVTAGSVEAVDGPVDIVVANLISDVVRDLAAELVALTREELLVSGITVPRRDDVLGALVAGGAEVAQVRERDGWIAARLRPSRRRQERGRGRRAGQRPSAGSPAHALTRCLAGAALAGLAVAGCTAPGVGQPTEAPSEPAPVEREVDPEARALAEEIAGVTALVERSRAQLDAVGEADTLQAAHARLERADGLLVSTPGSEETALLPIEPAERTAARSGRDALTELLTRAREAGGALGRGVVEVLRDPIAGDLGAWELDAPGVVETARAAGTTAGDVESASTLILELDGEATKAIAWIAFGLERTDLDQARAAARFADGHLEVVALVLGDLAERTGAGDADASDELGPVTETPQEAG